MTLYETILAVAALLVALTAIIVSIKKIIMVVQKAVRFFDEWLGTDEEPGFSSRLKKIEEDVKDVHKEVTYNSGSSLKDAVRRIEEYQKENHIRITIIEDHLTKE